MQNPLSAPDIQYAPYSLLFPNVMYKGLYPAKKYIASVSNSYKEDLHELYKSG